MMHDIQFETAALQASDSALESSVITELSEHDLDQVSGGLSLGNLDSFVQNSGNFFSQKNLSMGQATFAGPNGSGTISTLDFQQIDSGAFQNIAAQA